MKALSGWCLFMLSLPLTGATLGDRFAYLEETDPFYVHGSFPKLTTPQWVGEPGVEAVVIFAIDDLRAPDKYETFLRPLLDRLKKIDGRAPVSIYCNAIDPADPQFVKWRQEGLSLEVHTLSHPCPLLAKGDWSAAWETYHGCVELLNRVPGNKPVAFRMPCCDSMNSPSPRFYTELFSATNAAGQFLRVDSSVMNVITTNDASLPRELVMDENGRSRFWKYLPAQTNASIRVSMGSFVTTIEDYPYPYVIGGLGWEFPAVVPSDWEAQNLHGTNNPVTVADWEAALDVTVRKQGTFTFIFHPHGWISAQQMIEFVDHAVNRYGARVKFLNLQEAAERLDQHFLQGHSLRAANGGDHGVRLLDLNEDGYLDVVVGNGTNRWTRVWNPTEKRWTQSAFPVDLVAADGNAGAKFGRVADKTVLVARNEHASGAWKFESGGWVAAPQLLDGLELDGRPIQTSVAGRDNGVRLRDVDGDGQSEVMILNSRQRAVWTWQAEIGRWKPFPCVLPKDIQVVDQDGRDAGLRFVDLNGDGRDDLIFSDTNRYSVDLFVAEPRENLGFSYGWSFRVRAGERNQVGAVPLIVRGGLHSDNGAWFRRGHMWVQNEDTAHLPDKVDRRSFADLIRFDVTPSRTPEESLASMEVESGYVMELVAAEPIVQDPVAFEWGEDGRLWVVEMTDYPSGLDGKGKPGGRIRVLQDTDHDGRYDRSDVFLEDIGFPSGVMPWRRGILVSAAPTIFYAEDRDGDGRAEIRIPLLEGFGQGNQQHRVNGFELGLDNWVYAANGESGGRLRVVGRVPGQAIKDAAELGTTFDLRGHDLRFRPDEGRAEGVAGQTQFGRRRDDWGNWFGNNNPNWGWHYWIEERYLKRNPELPLRSLRQDLPDYDHNQRVFARSEPVVRFNWPGGFNQVTSANSLTPYRDDLPGMVGSVFISEPANNVIHREVLEPRGVSFRSHRAPAEQESEFVAGRDGWFRPTMLKTGPDGALYVTDMYRLVIEHPEYALPGIEKLIDLRAGAGLGRIYRIYPHGATLRPFRALDRFSTAELVAALDTGNGWTRDTAHRLLLHRADASAAEPLRNLVRAGKDPRGRLQALCVLDGLALLKPGDVLTALKDSHPGVREHAIRVSEEWLRHPEHGEVLNGLLALGEDDSSRVRFQLALSLGETKDPRAAVALLNLAIKGGDDSQMRTAVLSSGTPHAGAMLAEALTRGPNAQQWLEPLTALALAAGQEQSVRSALSKLTQAKAETSFASWQFAGLAGFLEVGQRRGDSWDKLVQRWWDPLESTCRHASLSIL